MKTTTDRRASEEPRRPEHPVETRSPRTSTASEPRSDAGPESRPGRLGRTAAFATLCLGAVLLLSATRWEPSTADAAEELTPEERPPAAAELAPTLEMPGEVNARVDRWIQHYLTDERRTFEAFLSRETIYGEMIRSELRSRGMPEDLLYLAMIESGFSANATSQVEASGLWQFMGPTAREYGLEIGDWVDERRDPIRATDAALDYLERLHERFGSWYLAAAAYNAGPNRVARAVREFDERPRGDEEIFWEIVDRLPSETRNYVPKLLAAVLLAKEAEEHGFEVERPSPYQFDRVWVPGGTSLDRVARALEIPASRLQDLNPHLVRGVTPPGTSYALRVPPGRTPTVVASLGRDWGLADD